MTRYKIRQDNEVFQVPSGIIYRIACVDCGLVHDFVFVSKDGKPIEIAARKNNRATAQRRRAHPPITADDVTAEMIAAVKKATPMQGVVTSERIAAAYNTVNTHRGDIK